MQKFKVFNIWSEEVLYQQSVEIEAETMEEAIKLSSDTDKGWCEPEKVDVIGDGSIYYHGVENLETEEYKDFYDSKDLIDNS
jgi:hypothetical protein